VTYFVIYKQHMTSRQHELAAYKQPVIIVWTYLLINNLWL